MRCLDRMTGHLGTVPEVAAACPDAGPRAQPRSVHARDRRAWRTVKYDVRWSRLPGMDEMGQPPGMQAARLHLARYCPVIEVRRGDYTIAAYRKDDRAGENGPSPRRPMGVSGSTAAALFSLTPLQISRIRGHYRQHGSAGLAGKRGRPAATPGQVRQAGRGPGPASPTARSPLPAVSRPLITALIGSHGPLYPEDELPGTGQAGGDGNARRISLRRTPPKTSRPKTGQRRPGRSRRRNSRRPGGITASRPWGAPVRYAGAMLTDVFTTRSARPASWRLLRPGRADAAADLAVLNATAMAFDLGADPGADQAPAGARRRADRPEPAAGPRAWRQRWARSATRLTRWRCSGG